MYPLKFQPVYKNYIWGGRNLEKLGKALPDGKIAESWEISCHPDGMSYICNGDFKNLSLQDLISEYGCSIIGKRLYVDNSFIFPLLVKLIDANDNLSVQVHPDDDYAFKGEKAAFGKNEMWYIISARPGARLVYGMLPHVTRQVFEEALKQNKVESCLKYIEVFPGDVLNIPSGLIHAIGEGIVLAEIQQNSNITYRVYDYDRVDENGGRRPLHITDALEVIDFSCLHRKEKSSGLKVSLTSSSYKVYMVANKYFSVELYLTDGRIEESTDGSCFYIYLFLEGKGTIYYDKGHLEVKAGESVLVPASLGSYVLDGNMKALKAYVPDIDENIILPLKKAGFTEEEIYENVRGLV